VAGSTTSRAGRAAIAVSAHIALSLFQGRRPWFISWSNKALATAPFPSGMVGRFLKPQIRAQHERPGFVTAYDHVKRPLGLALVDEPMAQLHGAQRISEATRFSISHAPANSSWASKKAEMAFMQLAYFGQPKTKALSPTGVELLSGSKRGRRSRIAARS
jgi:hypothetical protein